MLTPGSKKSISQNDKESSQKANFSENDEVEENDYLSPKRMKSSRFKGIQSKSDQHHTLKAHTEQKSKNFGGEFMAEDPGKYS